MRLGLPGLHVLRCVLRCIYRYLPCVCPCSLLLGVNYLTQPQPQQILGYYPSMYMPMVPFPATMYGGFPHVSYLIVLFRSVVAVRFFVRNSCSVLCPVFFSEKKKYKVRHKRHPLLHKILPCCPRATLAHKNSIIEVNSWECFPSS